MNEKTVTISKGEVVLRKPTAGQRNKALIHAENGREKPSQTAFIIALLPLCVKTHPFGTVPVAQALDSLEMEEYDKISKALGELIKPVEGIQKN